MESRSPRDETEIKLNKVYKRSFRRGRGALACAFDTGFALFTSAFALYICVRPRFKSSSAAWLVTLICLAAAALLWKAAEKELFARHVKRLRLKKKKQIALAKMLAEGAAFEGGKAEPGKYYARSIEALTADDVLAALRSGQKPVTIVSAAEPTKKAKELISSFAGAVRLEKAKLLSPSSPMPPVTEEETDEAVLWEYPARKRPVFKELSELARERPFMYFCLAGGLFVLSFFVRYALYFRLMASAAAGTGSAVLFFNKTKKEADKTAPEP